MDDSEFELPTGQEPKVGIGPAPNDAEMKRRARARTTGRPRTESPARITTAIRFDPALHEALKETAAELCVGVNWLVSRLCEEGLKRMDLTDFSLVRNG